MRPLARDVVARKGVLVIAHRGASADAPENTVPAFRAAVEAKADLVELDYHHSKDGVPVVFHDKTLDRTTDAQARWGGERLPLTGRTIEELGALDAGRWFDARFAGTRVPTLARALEVIQAGSTTLVERKAGDAATLLKLLQKHELVTRVVIQAFDWDFLQECRRLDADCVIAALGSKALGSKRLDRIEALGAAAVGWKHVDVTAEVVEAVHARGLKLWAWTVNDMARARELVALGVDGIITDRPSALRAGLRGESPADR